MTRRRWLLVLGVVVFVGASAAGAVLVGSSAAKPFGDPRTRAQQLLNELVLPPGTQRLRVPPRGDGGLLHQAQSTPGVTVSVHLHRIWRVHRSYFDVPDFVENHLPRDAQGVSRGSGGGPGIPYRNEDDTYSFPTSGNVSTFWLDLTFVGLPHGWTGIRADAVVGSCPCMHH
jgi:hypothetical protein